MRQTLRIPQNPMPTTDPAIKAYLARLATIKQYADKEGISVTQVYRRIEEKRADTEEVGGKVFVVLPDAATREPNGPPTPPTV
ncbi:hypothetical protein [Hymenobacter mucosus]|uniref:Uncharacterized protein n=1 Tax=Hymenobacter mucosus TaxID=1411120 RepID=A0A239A9W7_9BACT|nr:hypothetical protein [Hymenobacter mucosus]SNR92121.1 hypothetical protein SAMN06269173_11177 [Hymenobacter mucosus]